MRADPIKLLKKKDFDKSKWMQLPRDVVIGHNVIHEIPAVCRDLGLEGKALVVTGPTATSSAGDRVMELLERDGYNPSRYISHVLTPETIMEAEKAVNGASFLVGVGGGRVIDTAKIVSYNQDLPFLSVPTAASHDGIASAQASVQTEEGNISLAAHPPMGVVADTSVIATAPHRLLAAGCADIVANRTAVLDWELSHRLRGEPVSEYAIALSRMAAEIIIANADLIRAHTEESAWIVTKALVSSGVAMSIAGSSRPASGGEHKFAHTMERLAPGKGMHGELCGIGTIITMYLHGGDWEGVRDILRSIGAPTTPREIGVDDEIAVQALLEAHKIRPERFTILDIGLTEESASALVDMLYRG
ncbi:MAG: NAD(P)-dependent glycerol-1-phosphate dehydrogenase [Methanoculleaceae archaeon]